MLSAIRKLAAVFLVLAAVPLCAQSQPGPQDTAVLSGQQSGLPPAVSAAPSSGFAFPVYPAMFPNVRFWEKIYSTYTETQGVLHDKDDLDRIYRVINLLPQDTPGAGKINEKLIEMAKLHCQNVLKKFAGGGSPETSEELQIHALFKQKNPAVFLAAVDNMRVQTGLKNRFRAGVIRSGAYLPAIKRILRFHNLPLELAYLPHVESSFNPAAGSRVGAMGLWQFTAGTGRDFMLINELVDERYDLYAATNAAALFLKENYTQLGSWPLALTAYNHGRGGMLRAQQEWGAYPLIFASYDGKSFGFASKNFYSEFVAAYRVARRLENDPSVVQERPLISASLRLKDYASALELRQYFGVSEDEFRRLNPALRPPVLEGKKYIPKEVVIHLPATQFIRERIRTMPVSLFHSRQRSDPKPAILRRRGRSKATVSAKAAHHSKRKLAKAKVKARPVRKKKAKHKR